MTAGSAFFPERFATHPNACSEARCANCAPGADRGFQQWLEAALVEDGAKAAG